MELKRASERIWYSMYEEERDRPCLGYIRGSRWSLAVDVVFRERLDFDAGDLQIRLFRSISPHTDDTTLVYVPGERFLFVGDCISGVFPTWERDPEKTRDLIRTLEGIDFEYCLGGHWKLLEKQELLEALAQETI